jgi:uncharacterized circularly permuted ATP-grasp superfamily protein
MIKHHFDEMYASPAKVRDHYAQYARWLANNPKT